MHNKGKKEYMFTVSEIQNSLDFVIPVENDKEMSNAYIDKYTTNQQKLRDKKITELLEQYVSAYTYKNSSNKLYKIILFLVCISILTTFSVAFVIFVSKLKYQTDAVAVGNIVQIISVCITFLALIISVLQIITKYVFPENEDEYITRIVEIIQNNDLENKKQNINVKSNMEQNLKSDNKLEIEQM